MVFQWALGQECASLGRGGATGVDHLAPLEDDLSGACYSSLSGRRAGIVGCGHQRGPGGVWQVVSIPHAAQVAYLRRVSCQKLPQTMGFLRPRQRVTYDVQGVLRSFIPVACASEKNAES